MLSVLFLPSQTLIALATHFFVDLVPLIMHVSFLLASLRVVLIGSAINCSFISTYFSSAYISLPYRVKSTHT